jgi:hypothetical protein
MTIKGWVSSVSIVTRLRPGSPRFDSRHVTGCFSSPPSPDRLWNPFSLLSSGRRGFSLRYWRGRDMKLITSI